MIPKQGIIYERPSTQKKKGAKFGSQVVYSNDKDSDTYVGSKGRFHKIKDTFEKENEKDNYETKILQKVSDEGFKEGHKEFKRERVKSRDKFSAVHASSNNLLFECSAIFPFQLFPDKLTIDLHKVNLIYKYLPFSKTVQSIYINDVAEVDVSTGIFFATLKIIDKYFSHQENIITYLKKSDALKARRLIQGLIVAVREKIDLESLSSKDLVAKLEDLGKAVGQSKGKSIDKIN